MDLTSALSSSEKALAKRAELAIDNPSAGNALALDAAGERYLIAGMTVAKFLAIKKESRDAINRIMNRSVDTVA